MKKITTILFCLLSLIGYSQNDSIVFTLGGGNYVTIYKDGHTKRVPPYSTATNGKVLGVSNGAFTWITPSGYDGNPAAITQNSTNRFVTDAEKTTWSAKGYTLQVQALTSSPADAQTIYFGNLPKAPTTTANISKIYFRQSGTIKRAEIYSYSGTAGTNEAWVMHIRKNNTTDTQIASVSLATSERVFSNTSLNISVVSGDYIEIKSVNPTWATNPLTTIFGGYIYIE